MPGWQRLSVAAIVFALAGFFVALRFDVTSEMTHFLAADDDHQMARLSRRLADSELTRSMILSVAHERESDAMAAADQLAAELASLEEVAWVRSGWASEYDEVFQQLYRPRRLHFHSDGSDQALADALADEGLRASARELLRQLSLPTAALVSQQAPEDPLLSWIGHLERLQEASAGTLSVRDGHFFSDDGQVIVFLASRHSPFDSTRQAPIQAAIDRVSDDLRSELGSSLRIEQSGVGRFALRAEASIRRDITRISVVSTALVVLLFLLLFRSPRLLLLSLVPIAGGILLALAVTLALFGRVHGLTLAFGASLIGIAIDYPIHLFTHHTLDPGKDGGKSTILRVRAGLLLGAATTVAGFLGLAWTSFPGVREIAVFASVGITAALVVTIWLLPPLLPHSAGPGRLQRALAEGLAGLLGKMASRRRAMWILPIAALVVCALGLPRIRFVDDLAALTRQDPEMLDEDERVRGRVSRMEAGRLVVATGADEEAALVRNDLVYARLVEARADGVLDEFRSLHGFLWSEQLQRRNLQAFAEPDFFPRLARAYEAEGFRSVALAPFERFLGEPPPEPLRFADLEASPLGTLVRSFRVDVDGEVGILTFVRGVHDPAALGVALTDLEGVRWFDQKRLMSDLYRRHRVQVIQLVLVGLVLVFVMVLARYRSLLAAFAAFLPALFAAATTMAVLALAGEGINLLHVVSLLLVIGMGVDYGVFLAESRGKDVSSAVTAILLACVTTVFAFGLLGLSDSPALRAIGFTTGLGVCLSVVLAPTTLVLFRRETHDVE